MLERACRKVLTDVAIAYSQLHPETHISIDDGLAVERAEHDPLLIIGALDQQQHPLSSSSRLFDLIACVCQEVHGPHVARIELNCLAELVSSSARVTQSQPAEANLKVGSGLL